MQNLPNTNIALQRNSTTVVKNLILINFVLKEFKMKNLIFIIISIFFFTKCSSINSSIFQLTINGSEFNTNDTLKLRIQSNIDVNISETKFSLNGSIIDSTQLLSNITLGKHTVRAYFKYKGKDVILEKELTLYAESPPELYSYRIINTFPHDKSSFTQGLEFSDNILYESTGLKGQSKIRSINFINGEILKEKPLNENYFGEGLTIYNNQIYQLTWQENIGFIYDKDSFKIKGSFSYGKSKEGWGLCNDGEKFYKSDGSHNIWILDINSLNEVGKIQIMTNKQSINKINELEWVNGKIYANSYQFQKDIVLIINPISGMVEGVVDFSGLKNNVEQIKSLNVFNGIAYNNERNTFFVTGKNWSKLFEVEIFRVK